MQPRLAKKIVQRVQSGDVNRTSYRQDQVEAAFRVMGTPLSADLLKPWTEPRVTEDPWSPPGSPPTNSAEPRT